MFPTEVRKVYIGRGEKSHSTLLKTKNSNPVGKKKYLRVFFLLPDYYFYILVGKYGRKYSYLEM